MILVDSHIHIYDYFDRFIFFNTVWENFNKSIPEIYSRRYFSRVIFLTESTGVNYFNYLNKNPSDFGRWHSRRTEEVNSLILETDNSEKIIVILGKQLITKEKLEVLSIGVSETENNLPLDYTISSILNTGGIAVIPWGFGKWLGRRGKILNDYLEKIDFSGLFLGDNGGRPDFLPSPIQFRIAKKKGIKILPGSDPLPLMKESKRAATYGFILNETLNEEKPAYHIINLLSSLKKNPEYFGKLCPTHEFIKRQTLLRLKKYISIEKKHSIF